MIELPLCSLSLALALTTIRCLDHVPLTRMRLLNGLKPRTPLRQNLSYQTPRLESSSTDKPDCDPHLGYPAASWLIRLNSNRQHSVHFQRDA
ncbi:MAG: hypothetical protein J3Q66DRAFT_345415 [Benniella sp.]|nr:MAG: hypothetical protein J3Q66DRAFT_345415 [Benniella sp.]